MKPAKVSLLRRLLHSLKHVDCNIAKRFPSTIKIVKLLMIFMVFTPISSIYAEDVYQNFEELKTMKILLIMALLRKKPEALFLF